MTSIFERALQRYLDGNGSDETLIQARQEFAIPTLDGTGGLMPGSDLTDSARLQELSESDSKREQVR